MAVETRKLEYEKIRVCAMFFTILVHSLNGIPRETVLRDVTYNGLSLLVYTCNSLFFMLSGKFGLAVECGTFREYLHYYHKKLINMVVPILGYLFLRSLLQFQGRFWQAGFWRGYIENVCYRYVEEEYWFLYVLVGLAFVAPFLHRMVVGLGRKEMCLLLGIGLLNNALRTYAPYFDLEFYWQYILGEWAFYFVLGYCLERIADTRKKENAVIALGAVGFCISMVQMRFGMLSFLYDLAPTFTMISCAVFFLLKRMPVRFRLLQRLIGLLGRYSFAIYMVHNPIRAFLADWLPMDGPYLITLLVLAMSTLAVSFLVAFACENTFIRGLKLLFRGKKSAGGENRALQ